MPAPSASVFLESLRDRGLLTPEQSEQARRQTLPDRDSAGRFLRERGWLTAFQLDLLLADRGGELVLGPYVLLERLGEGGMGTVFKAQHQAMNRTVALKVIRKSVLSQPEAVRRFYREARAAAQLVHPNIALAFDAGQSGDTHYFAMEYVDGTDLGRLVKARGPVTVTQACDYIRQAALGLHFAHERGLVHRDVKPANLLLSRQGVIKIVDLGLARSQSGEDQERSLTQEGSVLGTPAYMAPEQGLNARTASPRSDIYSLGCTLFFLLSGRTPFQGETNTETLLMHHLQEAVPLEKLQPTVPAALGGIVRRLMAKRPEDRYQTGANVAEALAPFCGRSTALPPVEAESVSRERSSIGSKLGPNDLTTILPRETRPKSNRRRLRTVGVAAALLAGVLLLGGLLLLKTSTPAGSLGSAGPTAAEQVKPSSPAATVAWGPGHLRHVEVHPGGVNCIAISPSGGRILTGGEDNLVRLLDLNTGNEVQRFVGHKAPVNVVAFSAEGRRVVSAGADRKVHVWDIGTGKLLFQMKSQHDSAIVSATSSPDGEIIASGDTSGWLRFGYANNGSDWIGKAGHFGAVRSIAFLGKGRTIAFACGDGEVRIDDLVNTSPVKELKGHNGSVLCLAAFSDGRQLLSGGKDGTIRLWDTSSARELRRFTDSASPVQCLALARDGLRAASGGGAYLEEEGIRVMKDGKPVTRDCDVRLWDVAQGKELRRLQGHTGRITSVVFLQDGKTLLSAGEDGMLAWWDVSK